MADLEKVIKGLEIHLKGNSRCKGCPYPNNGLCGDQLMADALELLKAQGWISVKDRLPEYGEAYFAACRSLSDDREPWVIEGNYGIVTHGKPWGVPLISWGKAEVYARKPKVYPEPPKEERTDE